MSKTAPDMMYAAADKKKVTPKKLRRVYPPLCPLPDPVTPNSCSPNLPLEQRAVPSSLENGGDYSPIQETDALCNATFLDSWPNARIFTTSAPSTMPSSSAQHQYPTPVYCSDSLKLQALRHGVVGVPVAQPDACSAPYASGLRFP